MQRKKAWLKRGIGVWRGRGLMAGTKLIHNKLRVAAKFKRSNSHSSFLFLFLSLSLSLSFSVTLTIFYALSVSFCVALHVILLSLAVKFYLQFAVNFKTKKRTMSST